MTVLASEEWVFVGEVGANVEPDSREGMVHVYSYSGELLTTRARI